MNILITGGTGFLGTALTKNLMAQGAKVTLFCREPEKAIARFGSINTITDFKALKAEQHFQVVINLAGAPIFDRRWTEQRKQLLRASRVELTQRLVAAIEQMPVKPELLITGSAIGYYGDQGDQILTEQSAVVTDFAQQLCVDWEAAAMAAEAFGVRVCIIRTGLVLANSGGLLARMALPFKWGLGGQLGNGQQWMSWIHLQDWLAIVQAMIDNLSMQGVYNATAPVPVNNQEFTKILATALNRPAVCAIPACVLKLILGEMSMLVLGSQRVIPQRLLDQGFVFEYSQLAVALSQALAPVKA